MNEPFNGRSQENFVAIWDTPCGIDRFEVASDGCLESLLRCSFSAFLHICRQHQFEVIRFTPLLVMSLN